MCISKLKNKTRFNLSAGIGHFKAAHYIAAFFPNKTRSTLRILVAYRVFSLTWPAYMQIYCNKRKRLHKKRVQLPGDWFGTPTWQPFHCFGTPIWPPWRHVKTFYTGTRENALLTWTSSVPPRAIGKCLPGMRYTRTQPRGRRNQLWILTVRT